MSAHLPGEPCPCFDCRADEPEQQQEQPYPDEPYPDAPVAPDAVEAAARATYEADRKLPWEEAPQKQADDYRKYVQVGIDAAAPLIAKQTLLDAAGDYRTVALRAGTSPRAVRAWLRARAATLTPKDN